MRDWNVVAVVTRDRFKAGCDTLQPLGPVKRTHFYNTVVMRTPEIGAFMETLREWMDKFPETAEAITRVAPANDRFNFGSPQEFEGKAREILLGYLPRLAGKRFHVRVHRRDRRSRFSASREERLLGGLMFDELEKRGTPARLDFADPDAIVDIETVDDEAGVSLWTRAQLQRYPFLKLD